MLIIEVGEEGDECVYWDHKKYANNAVVQCVSFLFSILTSPEIDVLTTSSESGNILPLLARPEVMGGMLEDQVERDDGGYQGEGGGYNET